MKSDGIVLVAEQINKIIQSQLAFEQSQKILQSHLTAIVEDLNEEEREFVKDKWGIEIE
jgi:isochorismate hydrolase